MNMSQSSVCWAIFHKPFFSWFIPCCLFVPHHSPNQPCCPSFISASPPLTHKHWHSHTHTDLFILCLAGRPPACRVSAPPLLWLSGSATSFVSPPDPSPFPESCQSKAGCCVGVGNMDGWQMRCQGGRQGEEKGVLMDSMRVKVVPYCSVRWHGVRTDDPFTDPDFLHHHHCLTALPLLPACSLSEWLPGLGVHHQPPAGRDCHHTSGSLAAYGRRAGTSPRVQHCIITYEEKRERGVRFQCDHTAANVEQLLTQNQNDSAKSEEWCSDTCTSRTKETFTQARVCSLIGVCDLLAVACEGTSPLPKTFLMTINGPWGILNGSALAAVLVRVPRDRRDNSCCSGTKHLAER